MLIARTVHSIAFITPDRLAQINSGVCGSSGNNKLLVAQLGTQFLCAYRNAGIGVDDPLDGVGPMAQPLRLGIVLPKTVMRCPSDPHEGRQNREVFPALQMVES